MCWQRILCSIYDSWDIFFPSKAWFLVRTPAASLLDFRILLPQNLHCTGQPLSSACCFIACWHQCCNQCDVSFLSSHDSFSVCTPWLLAQLVTFCTVLFSWVLFHISLLASNAIFTVLKTLVHLPSSSINSKMTVSAVELCWHNLRPWYLTNTSLEVGFFFVNMLISCFESSRHLLCYWNGLLKWTIF